MQRKAKPSRAARSRRKTKARRPAARNTGALEQALAVFAHEVRTPLTGILALSELLSTSELGERERRWVESLKGAADHLAQLTTLVVDSARAGSKRLVLQREAFDLRKFSQSLADLLSARTTAHGLTCAITIAKDLPAVVVGDRVRLRAALENLLDNAVKFTDRGEIKLAVTAGRATRQRASISFAVADSGIGLTPAEIKRLFRPFAQANDAVARRFGGAGLGLLMVKRIAQAMGGRLAVESTSGRGATFRLTVILDKGSAAHATSAQGPAANKSAASGPALRILCAEDNPYGRVILKTILNELGHTVDFVGSGEAAVAAVARGGYDAVLMDIVLTGIDGYEAARRIRALPGAHARVPIVGLSGHSTSEGETAARQAGMNGYLVKPVSPSLLANALAAARAAK